MANKILNVRVQQRGDTESNWASKNPVLLKNEMAISTDKDNRYKVGNGTSKWSELSYAKANLTSSDVTGVLGFTPANSNHNHDSVYSKLGHTHSYLPLSGGTLSGALNLANSTWNTIGDDVAIGDMDIGGTLGIRGLNGNTGIKLVQNGATTTKGASAPGVSWTCTGNNASTISGTLSGTFTGSLSGNATTSSSCTGNSATATSAVDYNNTSAKINIGYSGDGISGDDIKYIAGYTTGTNGASANIKDISKDALKSWLGLGSLAYSSATIPTIPSSLPANGGNASTVNGHTVNTDVPSGAVFTDTNTWRPLGTTADTACAGNDARLSNARPASDVYSWAKASSKPSYTWNEITDKPSSFTPSSHTHSSLRAKVGAIPTTFSQSDDHSLTYNYLNNTNDKYVYITMKSQKTYATQIRAWGSDIAVRILTDKASNWDQIVTSSSLGSALTSASVKYATTAGSANSVAWGNVSGKPSTFTPSSHSHAISDITNLQSTLDGKAASSHSHSNYVTWTNKIFDDPITLKDVSGIYWKTNANASITALSMLNSDGSKTDKSGMVVSADTVQLTTSDVTKVMGTFALDGLRMPSNTGIFFGDSNSDTGIAGKSNSEYSVLYIKAGTFLKIGGGGDSTIELSSDGVAISNLLFEMTTDEMDTAWSSLEEDLPAAG